jgi:hypothetical protein
MGRKYALVLAFLIISLSGRTLADSLRQQAFLPARGLSWLYFYPSRAHRFRNRRPPHHHLPGKPHNPPGKIALHPRNPGLTVALALPPVANNGRSEPPSALPPPQTPAPDISGPPDSPAPTSPQNEDSAGPAHDFVSPIEDKDSPGVADSFTPPPIPDEVIFGDSGEWPGPVGIDSDSLGSSPPTAPGSADSVTGLDGSGPHGDVPPIIVSLSTAPPIDPPAPPAVPEPDCIISAGTGLLYIVWRLRKQRTARG